MRMGSTFGAIIRFVIAREIRPVIDENRAGMCFRLRVADQVLKLEGIRISTLSRRDCVYLTGSNISKGSSRQHPQQASV